MKIAIACDHGALHLKNALIPFLRSLGHSVRDFGTHSTDSCDYPDYAIAAAKAVAEGDCDKGIVLCTTGIGVSIAANKVNGIRCALLSDVESARMTRLHNDTNMMAMGAAVVSQQVAFSIVETWLATPFSNEDRHQRRIDKITDCERGQKKKRNKTAKQRRPQPLLNKVINLVLCLLLIIALNIIPIANYITNMTDPSLLVNALFESDLFKSVFGNGDEVVPEATEPETTNPDAAGSEGGETVSTAKRPSSGYITKLDGETTVPGMGAGVPAGFDLSSLLSGLQGLIDSGIIDEEVLKEGLSENGEDIQIDMEKVSADLVESNLAKDLATEYFASIMDSAVNPDAEPTFNEEKVKEILNNNMEELTTIVNNNLPEGMEISPEVIESAVTSAVDVALPTVMENLPDTSTIVESITASNPVIAQALTVVKFIRTGALRAIVLLAVIALCILVTLNRLPGLRGLTSVGISSIVAAIGCGGVHMVLRMPMLTGMLTPLLSDFAPIVLPLIGGLSHAFRACAIVYAVIGVGLFLSTTILRGFFTRIFDAVFSND